MTLILVCLDTKDSYRSGNPWSSGDSWITKKWWEVIILPFLNHRWLRILSDQIRPAF